MKYRVIIVPVSEIKCFFGMTVIARGGSIAALLGSSFNERCRNAFGSDEEFFDAAATGRADLNTFGAVAEAARFAEEKIEALNAEARRIEEVANGVASFPHKGPLPDTPEAISIGRLCA